MFKNSYMSKLPVDSQRTRDFHGGRWSISELVNIMMPYGDSRRSGLFGPLEASWGLLGPLGAFCLF